MSSNGGHQKNRVPFQLSELSRDEIARVRLFVSEDQGKTWQLVKEVEPNARQFDFFLGSSRWPYFFAVQSLGKDNKLSPGRLRVTLKSASTPRAGGKQPVARQGRLQTRPRSLAHPASEGKVTQMPAWKSDVFPGAVRDWWIYVPPVRRQEARLRHDLSGRRLVSRSEKAPSASPSFSTISSTGRKCP